MAQQLRKAVNRTAVLTGGGRRGRSHLLALIHLTSDHAFLSRRSTVPIPNITRGGGQLRAGAHAGSGQILFYQAWIDSGGSRTIACSNGIQQGDSTKLVKLCLALRSGLSHFREEFDGTGAEALSYVGGSSPDLTGVYG